MANFIIDRKGQWVFKYETACFQCSISILCAPGSIFLPLPPNKSYFLKYMVYNRDGH